jgi:hypothetical protein
MYGAGAVRPRVARRRHNPDPSKLEAGSGDDEEDEDELGGGRRARPGAPDDRRSRTIWIRRSRSSPSEPPA